MRQLIALTPYSLDSFHDVPGKVLVGFQRVMPSSYSDKFKYGEFLAEPGMHLTSTESKDMDKVLNRIYHITGKWKHMPITGLADWLNENLPDSITKKGEDQVNYLFHVEGMDNIPVFFSFWPDSPGMDYPLRLYVYRNKKEKK